MQPRTIFLSKVIGLYELAMAVAMLINKAAFIEGINALVHNPPELMMASILALILGLLVVLRHNVWSGGALPVLVTIVGWISLLKGVIFLWLPHSEAEAYMQALHMEQLFYVYAILALVLGAFMTYGGFKSR
jgi:hypothetical protein